MQGKAEQPLQDMKLQERTTKRLKHRGNLERTNS